MAPLRLFVKSVKKSAVSKYAELTGEARSSVRLSVGQNAELSNQYIRELASDKPYHGELLNTNREAHANRTLHLRLIISDRVEDGIERSPEQTFKRYDASHPERGGRRKSGCGKSKAEMGDELRQTRRMLTDLQEHALLEAEAYRLGSTRQGTDGYAPGQLGLEPLHAYADNRPDLSQCDNILGGVVYSVS